MQYATTGLTITYTGVTNNVTIDKCRISNNSSKGIYVNGNGYSGASIHPIISNSHIHHNSTTGITAANYGKPKITGNQVEYNNSFGIDAATSYTGEVSYNRVANNGSNGLVFYASSHAQVHRNTIEANAAGGVYAFSNSNLTTYGGTSRNEITGNTGTGIYANSSSPTFGISPNGNSWIQNNSNYEAQQVGSGYQIRAENCYWGGGAPAPTEIAGNVDYTPYTTTLPNPVGWGQSDGYDPSYIIVSGGGKTIAELLSPETPPDVMASASAFEPNDPATDWTEELKAAIDEGLKTGDWSRANELITALHRELQDARIPEVDFAVITDYANDSKVASFIGKMLALVLMEKDLAENKIADALAKSDDFKQSKAEHEAEFLANAGLIHLYRQNDLVAAQDILGQLQELAKNGDAIAEEHVKFFGRIIEDYEGQRSSEGGSAKPMLASDQAHALPVTIVLAQNYPNPFNPETTIRFHVPGQEAQEVSLIIFNMLGQQVRSLAIGRQNPGNHIVQWDGRDDLGQELPSGTYLLRANIGKQILKRKLMLLR